MLPKTAPKLTNAELLHLISEARNVEVCRDLDALRKVLQTVWNVEETPNFDNYDEVIKSELQRLCGVFLSFYGYARNLKDYQIRGKDLLINSIENFEASKISDKAAEAKINLAFCYWNLGEIDEAEAILNIVEADFNKNLFHPIYLRICVNRLLICFWKKDIESAIKIIENIEPQMQFCTDIRLQAMFNNQSGIFYRAAKQYDKAVFHLNEAIRFAEKAKNELFIAINLNNLAFLYKEIKDYDGALKYIEKSINKFNQINNIGFLPHALDTKALIYLDWNKVENALETINKSIEVFKQGEDYRGLTDALWTKIRCLFRVKRSEDALFTYGELHQIAIEQIGEAAVKKFAKNLAEEIYTINHLPLLDEVAEFKKARVSAALIEANGVVGKAAEILQLKNHQALSEILNKQFPGLLDELGFRRRAKRNTVRSKKLKPKKVENNSVNALSKYKISRLVLTDKHFSFDFKFSSPQFETYYFNKSLMRTLGVDSEAVVVVVPVEKLEAGMLVLISNKDKFSVGKVEHEEWASIYFMLDEKGYPIPIDEENLVGEVIGFCPVSKADNKYIKFSRFKF